MSEAVARSSSIVIYHAVPIVIFHAVFGCLFSMVTYPHAVYNLMNQDDKIYQSYVQPSLCSTWLSCLAYSLALAPTTCCLSCLLIAYSYHPKKVRIGELCQ